MRKKKIINKKFQLGMTMKLVGFSMMSFLILIIMVIGLFRTFGTSDVPEQAGSIEKAIATQDAIIKSFIEYSNRAKNTNITVVADSINADHAKSMEAVKKNFEMLKSTAQRDKYIMMAAIAVMFVHLIILCFYLINRTNKIYGPIYVMSQYLDDIKNNKKASVRKLRDGDEFTEFYEKFINVIGTITFDEKKKKAVSKKARAPKKRKVMPADIKPEFEEKVIAIDRREVISK